METLITAQDKQPLTSAKKPIGVAFVISLVLFLIVFLGTVGLKLYVFVQDKKLENIEADVTSVEQVIATLKSNPDVNAYSLWDKAKNNIEMQVQKSEAQRYLARLDEISRTFFRKISFTGFNYADGKVETNAIAFGVSIDATANVISLLRNYRGKPATEDTVFTLDPILSLSGDPTRREFPVTFHVSNAPSTPSVNATSTGTTSSSGTIK